MPTEDFPLFEDELDETTPLEGLDLVLPDPDEISKGESSTRRSRLNEIIKDQEAYLEKRRAAKSGSDEESDSSERTLRQGEVDSAAGDAASGHYQLPIDLRVDSTAVFGRKADGSQEDPPTYIATEDTESRYERAERKNRFAKWASFCRFLNESRWMVRSVSGDKQPELPVRYDEPTPEDYLYQMYLKYENDVPKQALCLAQIDKEEMDKISERRGWFNWYERTDWAGRVLDGEYKAQPIIHKGWLKIDYVVKEENMEQDPMIFALRRQQFKDISKLYRGKPHHENEFAQAHEVFCEEAKNDAFYKLLRQKVVGFSSISSGNSSSNSSRSSSRDRNESQCQVVEKEQQKTPAQKTQLKATTGSGSSSTSSGEAKSKSESKESTQLRKLLDRYGTGAGEKSSARECSRGSKLPTRPKDPLKPKIVKYLEERGWPEDQAEYDEHDQSGSSSAPQ